MNGDQPPSRFAHLLQPIRDLSKVWKIEIAEELERYIEEVSQLVVTNPGDGISQLNFAEAALLIQGSCAVYSRKVELLYQLVYQALDLLALDKSKEGAPGKRGKATHSGLWAPIPDTEELLTIDHLIKEGRNIYLDPNAPEQRQAEQRRMPLFLMPRDQADRRKREFRISTCHVHHTGAYLLQESDARLLDELLSEDRGIEDGHGDAPLIPAPPPEVQDLDDRLQELLRELPPAPVADDPRAGSPRPEDATALEHAAPAREDGLLRTPQPGAPPAEARPNAGAAKKAFLRGPDPWALLDEHAPAGQQDVPLEVGRTCRKVNEKKLLLNAEGLPDLTVAGSLGDDALWGEAAAESAAPLLLAGHPVESLFLAVAGRLKSGGRFEVQRAGFSSAWLEMEDLFAAAAGRRRQLKAGPKSRPAPGAPTTPMGEGRGDASDDEAGFPDPRTPEKLGTPLRSGVAVAAPGSQRDGDFEEKRQQVAELENMIQDAQHKYEATVREHLQMLHKDSVDAESKRFPQLYENVRRWQDQLEPVLKEFASRPEFDIESYSTKLVTKMQTLSSADEEEGEQVIPFARLVYGQPRWEVCRRFLTCLLLTNQGNTDIVFDSEEDRINNFSIRLLKAERAPLSLDGGEAAQQPAAGATSKRRGHPKGGTAPLPLGGGGGEPSAPSECAPAKRRGHARAAEASEGRAKVLAARESEEEAAPAARKRRRLSGGA